MLPENIKDIRFDSHNDDLRKFFNIDCPIMKDKFIDVEDKFTIVKDTYSNTIKVGNRINGYFILYNNNGPTTASFVKNKISKLIYKILNNLGESIVHRVHYPALYYFDLEELYIIKELYYRNGIVHNNYGPAIRFRTCKNTKWYNYFYLNGNIINSSLFFLKENTLIQN